MGKDTGNGLNLHKLDSDHEGLLWVGPVQLPGSVADLGKAGGQIHGRRAMLGQFTKGHQLGDGGAGKKEGSGLAKSTAPLPLFFLKGSEPLLLASAELDSALQGEQVRLCLRPPGKDQSIWGNQH